MIFSWFKASCPIELNERVWIENRLNWLVGQFGEERFKRIEDILPSDSMFEGQSLKTEAEVRQFFPKICQRMDIDPDTVELRFQDGHPRRDWAMWVDEGSKRNVCGTYQKHPKKSNCGLLHLSRDELESPQGVVATLAHELCHHLLHGAGLLADELDNEMVTDLLTVMLGFGYFNANESIQSKASFDFSHEYWSIGSKGYLFSRDYGYALGARAFWRGESKPSLLPLLNTDVSTIMKKTMKYLKQEHAKSDHDLIFPGSNGRPLGTERSLDEVHEDLTSDSPAKQLSATYEIWAQRAVSQRSLAVLNRVYPRVSRAAQALILDIADDHAPESNEWHARIAELLLHPQRHLRARALDMVAKHKVSLSQLCSQALTVEDRLVELLTGDDAELSKQAAQTISIYGKRVNSLTLHFKPALLYAAQVENLDDLEFYWAVVMSICGRKNKALKQLKLEPEEREQLLRGLELAL